MVIRPTVPASGGWGSAASPNRRPLAEREVEGLGGLAGPVVTRDGPTAPADVHWSPCTPGAPPFVRLRLVKPAFARRGLAFLHGREGRIESRGNCQKIRQCRDEIGRPGPRPARCWGPGSPCAFSHSTLPHRLLPMFPIPRGYGIAEHYRHPQLRKNLGSLMRAFRCGPNVGEGRAWPRRGPGGDSPARRGRSDCTGIPRYRGHTGALLHCRRHRANLPCCRVHPVAIRNVAITDGRGDPIPMAGPPRGRPARRRQLVGWGTIRINSLCGVVRLPSGLSGESTRRFPLPLDRVQPCPPCDRRL
jgi:hypothetical protein